MLGYQPISVIARLGPLDLVAPASRAQAEDTLGRLLSGAEGSIRTEVQMLRKDGHTIDLEILGNAILMGGERPAVRVEGDVQLAADVNWLVDHLRWDIEEDLSRVIGDAPAHALARAARDAAQALQQFVRGRPRPPADKAPA